VIFLFKYPVGQNKAEETIDGEHDYNAMSNMFFANQTIQNACATQAILSVLLNKSELDVGSELRDFKEFTEGFPSDVSWLPNSIGAWLIGLSGHFSCVEKLYQILVGDYSSFSLVHRSTKVTSTSAPNLCRLQQNSQDAFIELYFGKYFDQLLIHRLDSRCP